MSQDELRTPAAFWNHFDPPGAGDFDRLVGVPFEDTGGAPDRAEKMFAA